MTKRTLTLYKQTLEEDALGNTVPVGNGAPLLTVWCRATFYNAELTSATESDIRISSRASVTGSRLLTKTKATISAPITYAQALMADYLELDGEKYRILDVIDASPRWTVYIAERWRA